MHLIPTGKTEQKSVQLCVCVLQVRSACHQVKQLVPWLRTIKTAPSQWNTSPQRKDCMRWTSNTTGITSQVPQAPVFKGSCLGGIIDVYKLTLSTITAGVWCWWTDSLSLWIQTDINKVKMEPNWCLISLTGSPMQFYVDTADSTMVTAYGPGLCHGTVNKPATFTVITKNAKEGKRHIWEISTHSYDSTLINKIQ